ncbi:MAG: M56 family metallopeptidase [Porphyromonas sp.]|nr:M56 family metallopeptidase [Porphyromonas sp.]
MDLFRYLTLSGVGIALFFIIDRLLLNRSGLLKTQRRFFVISIAAALLLPILSTFSPLWTTRVAETNIPTITISLDEEFVITPEQSRSIDLQAVGHAIWWLGIVVMVCRLFFGLVMMNRIRRHSKRQKLSNGIHLYFTEKEITPFTFWRSIYIPDSLNDPDILGSVLQHELEHIQQKHYIDMLLGYPLQLVQWWNPFAWSLLQQQRNTLEYLADQGVLRQGKDRKAYQYHLLKCTVGRTVQLPSLSFSMQNLKQRIFMMNSNKKSRKSLAIIYSIAAAPIVALLLIGTQMITVKKAWATENREVTPPPTQTDEVYEKVDDLPEFPGGQTALMKWLSGNLQYPEEAVKKNISGVVIMSFIVEKDGSITNAEVVRSVDETLDAEVHRLVKNMPKWVPGKLNGQPVRVKFSLPVNFTIREDKSTNEVDKGTVFETAHVIPEFPGGDKALMQWLSQNIRYPEEAVKQNIQGRPLVSFIIEKDGSITDIKVVKSIHPLLDAEAIRIVQAMPKWIPGKDKEGNTIRTRFTIPLLFKLKDDEAQNDRANKFAEFPGGMNHMLPWIKDHIAYHKEAADQKIEGTPIVFSLG